VGKLWKSSVPSPWDGVPGFWAAWNRFFFFFEGSAQVGIVGEERPQLAPEEQRCPLCGGPMTEHRLDRSGPGGRTILHCPPRPDHQEPGE